MKPMLLSLAWAAAASAAPLWKEDGNRTLELTDADRSIVRFVLDATPRDPHFEILATADGRNTVWVGPPDHVWHYGLWFSWKSINGVNFWETSPATGKLQGLNRIEEPVIRCRPDGSTATIHYRELSHPDPAGPAVLEDRVEIEIEGPTADRGPQVTWRITTTAMADVTLDRTPLPGEPEGKDWGGYAGFSWRGSKEFKDLDFTDSEDRQGLAVHRQRARWLTAQGSLLGKPAGLLFLSHPHDKQKQTSWYVFNQAKLPFWFANPALLQPGPIQLAKGQSLRHSYRVIVRDGWTKPECTAAAEAFGHTAGE